MLTAVIDNKEGTFDERQIKQYTFSLVVYFCAVLTACYSVPVFFQVVLLSSYYEYMKIQETAAAAKQIKDAWFQEPDNLNNIVSNIADTQKIYIEISDSNRPYFRASSVDKSNKEVYSLITSLDPEDMKEVISGENTFFTATIPRTKNDSKAIVLISQLDDGTESTFFNTNGVVRLYIFNYLEPLGTTTDILHSQLNLTAGIIIIAAVIMSVIFLTAYPSLSSIYQKRL